MSLLVINTQKLAKLFNILYTFLLSKTIYIIYKEYMKNSKFKVSTYRLDEETYNMLLEVTMHFYKQNMISRNSVSSFLRYVTIANFQRIQESKIEKAKQKI